MLEADIRLYKSYLTRACCIMFQTESFEVTFIVSVCIKIRIRSNFPHCAGVVNCRESLALMLHFRPQSVKSALVLVI